MGEANETATKEDRARVERYFVSFFDDVAIEEINQAAVDRYFKWRIAYWKTGPGQKDDVVRYKAKSGKGVIAKRLKTKPSQATLIKELNSLRRILKFAVREGVLKERDLPSLRPPRGEVGRRPDFEDHEIDELLAYLEERCFEPNILGNDKDLRIQLWAFAVIAISTGMRPSEAVTLNWNNISGYLNGKDVPLKKVEELSPDKYELRFTIHDKKRNRRRRIVPLRSMTPTILKLWTTNFKQEGPKPVFIDDFGSQIKSYGQAIRRTLDKLGIRYSSTGQGRTQYSFRHYYITRMIRAGKSPAFVAHNVGTSIEMIERFYLHGDVEHYAEQLGEF